MRTAMPRITESADELQHRMQSELDRKKRQRLQAFYLAASGQARHRQEIAALLGVHRHSVLSASPSPRPPAYHRDGLNSPARKTPGPARLCELCPDSGLVSRGASGVLGLFECP